MTRTPSSRRLVEPHWRVVWPLLATIGWLSSCAESVSHPTGAGRTAELGVASPTGGCMGRLFINNGQWYCCERAMLPNRNESCVPRNP
ncbi:MAG TPA: hypothetical protein VIV60_12990 [Polyangiaceae bacterium]